MDKCKFESLGMNVGSRSQIVSLNNTHCSLCRSQSLSGNATWVGVGYMVMLAPVNVVIFSVVSKMRRKVLHYSDLRVKMMNEILAGIRIIKFYAWERPFGKEVNKLRQKELEALTKLAYVTAIGFSLILLSAPIIQPILVFLTYVKIQDDPLDAATAFTTVALFNIMRFPFAFMPMGLLQFIQSKISLRRLERYLQLPELNEYVVDDAPAHAEEGDDAAKEGSVTIQDGSFSWIDPEGPEVRPVQEDTPSQKKKKKKKKKRRGSNRSGEESGDDSSMKESRHSMMSTVTDEEGNRVPVITLRDISVTVRPGSLTAVVGSVGSGKSSLLSAMLGEMEPIHGSKVYMPRDHATKSKAGFVSYCAQSPWVVNDTLKGNILFGREFDQARYDEVVEACALLDDLAVLPAGDMTEIGEKGKFVWPMCVYQRVTCFGGRKSLLNGQRFILHHRYQLVGRSKGTRVLSKSSLCKKYSTAAAG
jgi:ABC-type multidrug transport system fused ATPase/permease subunit